MRTAAILGTIVLSMFMLVTYGFADEAHQDGAPARAHRYIIGHVIDVSAKKNEIKLRTSQGQKAFSIKQDRSNLLLLKEETPVTIELNAAGQIIDLHRMGVRYPTGRIVTEIDPGLIF